jgi:hypothetical protein
VGEIEEVILRELSRYNTLENVSWELAPNTVWNLVIS